MNTPVALAPGEWALRAVAPGKGTPRAVVPALAGAGTAPVRVDGCQGCGACLLTCPEHAFRPIPGGLQVRADRCTGCGECLEICPVNAIVIDVRKVST